MGPPLERPCGNGYGMMAAAQLSPLGAGSMEFRNPASRDPLEEIIFRKAFGRGRVTLSSGKESTFYFDMKPAMLDPEGAYLIAERILREARLVVGEFVRGLEMGAVPITGAVCRHGYKTDHPVQG